MLDYRFIKENLAAVKANIAARNMVADADLVVQLFDQRTALVTELQQLQQKRNDNAKAMKGKLPDEERHRLIEEGKAVKELIAGTEKKLTDIEAQLMAHPDAPVGSVDSENLEVKRVGTPRTFDFSPKDHVQLGQELDLIDFDEATKVSGNKFYYLKNEAVFLEQALVMYALNILRKHGFTPFITPDVAREEILQGIGFNPRGNESNVYALEDEHACLVATAEITLGGYHSVLRSVPLLPAGSRGCRSVFKRVVPGSPVYKAGNVCILSAGAVRRPARKAAPDRRGNLFRTGNPVQGRGHLYR